MSLRALLSQLAVVTPVHYKDTDEKKNTEDELHDLKVLDVIYNALLHPAYLQHQNSFIVNRIHLVKDANLKSALTAINNFLLNVFANDATTYSETANNEHYKAMKEFWQSLPILKEEYYLAKIDEKRKLIEEQEEKLSSGEVLKAEAASMDDYIQEYTNCCQQLELYAGEMDVWISHLSIERKTTLKSHFQKREKLLRNKYNTLLFTTMVYEQTFANIDDHYYPILFQFSKEAEKDIYYYIGSIEPKMLQELQSRINDLKQVILKIQVKSQHQLVTSPQKIHQGNAESFISHSNDPMNETGKSPFQLSFAPFPKNEIYYDLFRRVAVMHQWMYTRINIEETSINQHLHQNLDFVLSYAQFDKAEVLIQKQNTEFLGLQVNLTSAQASLIAALETVGSFIGIGRKDTLFWREFNFFHYAAKVLQRLRLQSAEELLLSPSAHSLYHLLIEAIIIQCWRAAHNDLIKVSAVMQSNRRILQPLEYNYYRWVTEQQYLIMAAEYLTEMQRLQMPVWEDKASNESIQKYISQEKFEQYIRLYGTDGFRDILMEKIYELANKQMHALALIPVPLLFPAYHPEAHLAAERHYQELLQSLDQEQKNTPLPVDEELKKKKITYKTRTQKVKTTHQAFFKAKVEESLPTKPPRSKEAALYRMALETRKASNTLEPAIKLYEEIVDDYIKKCETKKDNEHKEESPDYFFIAAALIELSDCYILKGMGLTQNDFSQYDQTMQKIPEILAPYKQAVKFAKHADHCYKKHVSLLPEKAQEEFESLATSISMILKSATETLEYMKKKFKSELAQLEKTQAELALSRAQAKEWLGEEKWHNNTAPKQTYSLLRKKNADKMTYMKKAVTIMDEFLVDEVEPVKKVFNFLAGVGELPLLTCEQSSTQLMRIKSDDPLHGGGEFKERLKLLTHCEALLTDGKDRRFVLKQLMEPLEDKQKQSKIAGTQMTTSFGI